jgi:hypothetical protein
MSTAEQLKQYEELAAGALLLGRDRHASAIMALLADVDRLTAERDALAAELAQVRGDVDNYAAMQYEAGRRYTPDRFMAYEEWQAIHRKQTHSLTRLDVSKMSAGQLQVTRDPATNRLFEVYCAPLEPQA